MIETTETVQNGTRAILTGAEAMARGAELAGVEVATIFPITPQTQVIESLSQNDVVSCLRSNSEYNSLSIASGVAWAGTRVFTVTSSQGLVFMSEMMWEVAGNRLPIVMGVFGRALKGPGWNLGPQDNDSLMMRDTGWLMFYCETAQEVLDFTILAYRIAEDHQLPVMVIGDGFYLSHTTEIVSLPDAEAVKDFLPAHPPRQGLPSAENNVTFAPLTSPETHFDFYADLHRRMEDMADGPLTEIFGEYEERFGRSYDVVEAVNVESAQVVVITTATIAGTVRALLMEREEELAHFGLIKLRSMRPFPGKQIAALLRNTRKVIVIDRNISPCVGGIVAAELSSELHRFGHSPLPWIYSVVAGLGGLPVDRDMIYQQLMRVYQSDRPPEEIHFLR